ncbi:sn-glycerol-3-phosphate ABC transporter ATP-binding protein UgpC [Pseudooceanicola sp. CBS1P-1]|uniref:sn-glycerol-3-phosphate ABC transporter ATP-binding protein UgpC n=1 Tax=Pseudooceanicola albus TaxID=2692189 RepID=A0A6L7G7L1_9RHOB|nr:MULTISPECIES: sn-glycerol-3-phosphate ABC transporter ATP-binding protein UgpC [Pseudooceanicola]MBT9385927.1 sn-glycerol-3-phosphate ABC transporter ATP-binding protein UgpC [Pseudooceanicola endophyticus]MXN19652.1 sn-glycerol-3-phosphate ABC transporter ATP-binding protein UgpC [Pseudooceanicola albus]
MSEIEFRGVTKSYPDGYTAIRGLDMTIREGEFLVLVGPSGCGKSTALRMIAGLEEISGGDLMIGGVRSNDLAPRDRDIAMVFQSYALYPHLTVAQNIGFGLKVRGMAKAEIAARVQETARLLELDAHLARKPGQLSGGQRQRVAMGRALVRTPQAFLMDEPLSNLDARLRAQMRADVARLQRASGVTTVYVTHDQVEAMTMGDRVAVMNAGELLQLDTPRRLYDAPADLFVASFIGTPPMSFLSGTIEGDRLRTGQAEIALPRPPRPGPVIAGIRPEALVQDAEGPLHGEVAFVEDLGASLLAHVALPEGALVRGQADQDGADLSALRLRVSLPATAPLRPGTPIRLTPDAARLHFFDPATGKRI